MVRNSTVSLTLVLALIGCKSELASTAVVMTKLPETTLASPPVAEPPPPAPPVVRPPAPGPGEPGPAYFAIDDKGIVKLDDDGFTLLHHGPDKFIRELMIGPDGKLLALTFSELTRLEGDRFVRVFSFGFDDIGSVDALAFDGEGNYFAVSYNGLGEWNGGRWTVTKKEGIDAGVKLLNGVATGYDGSLWVASSNDLHRRFGGAWTKLDVSGLDRMPFFNTLQTSPTGDIYAQAGNYLAKINPSDAPPKVEKIEFEGTQAWGFNETAFSPDGKIGLGSVSCDLVRMDPSTPESNWVRNGAELYGCESLTALALDGQERMWVGSRAGLHVLGPALENVAYRSGSVLELVGNLKSIAVVGLGPKLPTPGKVATATLTGKILMDGEPLAKAEFEFCPQPAILTPANPCADSNVRFSGTTRKDGTFEIKKIPLGNYGVAVKIDGTWRTSWLSDFGVQMKPNQTYDVGAVKFSPTE